MSKDVACGMGDRTINSFTLMDKSPSSQGYHENQSKDSQENSQEDHSVSFHHLMAGIKQLDDERVDFFARLAAVLPKLEEHSMDGYDNIDIPESPRFWTRVLHHLIQQNAWLGVWCLLHPESQDQDTGHWSPLHGRARDLTTKDIQVSALLTSLSDLELTNWGIQLAICLLKSGAAVESISADDMEPLAITAVRSAVRTGKTDLLYYVLECKPSLILSIDDPDINGDTPLHMCVKAQIEVRNQHQTGILQTLLDLGCCTSVQDSHHKPAIHYVKPPDLRHQMLEEAAIHAGNGLRKRIDEMKKLGDETFQRDKYAESLRWYKQALSLAESVKNLKLELALIHSCCASVYAFMAVSEDQDADTCSANPSLIEDTCNRKKNLAMLLSNMRCLSDNSLNSPEDDGNSVTSDVEDEDDGSIPQDADSSNPHIRNSQANTVTGISNSQENSTVVIEKNTNAEDHDIALQQDGPDTQGNDGPKTQANDGPENWAKDGPETQGKNEEGDMQPKDRYSVRGCRNKDLSNCHSPPLECDEFDSPDEGTLTDSSDCDTVVDITETDKDFEGYEGIKKHRDDCLKSTGYTLETSDSDHRPQNFESEDKFVKHYETGCRVEVPTSEGSQMVVCKVEPETGRESVHEPLSKDPDLLNDTTVSFGSSGLDSFQTEDKTGTGATDPDAATTAVNVEKVVGSSGEQTLEPPLENEAEYFEPGSATLELEHARQEDEKEEQNTSGRLGSMKSDDERLLFVKTVKDSLLLKLPDSSGYCLGEIKALEEKRNDTSEHPIAEIYDSSLSQEPNPLNSDVTEKLQESEGTNNIDAKILDTVTCVEYSSDKTVDILPSDDGDDMNSHDPSPEISDDVATEETSFDGNLQNTANKDQRNVNNETESEFSSAKYFEEETHSLQIQGIASGKEKSTENEAQDSGMEKSYKSKQKKSKNKKCKSKQKPSKPLPIDENYLGDHSREETRKERNQEAVKQTSQPKPQDVKNKKDEETIYVRDTAKQQTKPQTVSECKDSIAKGINDRSNLMLSAPGNRNNPTQEGECSKKMFNTEAEEVMVYQESGFGNETSLNLDLDDIDEEDIVIEMEAFDNTTWEVECTAKAWKHLREYNVPHKLKQKTIKVIENLACGSWEGIKREKVGHTAKGVFETKLSSIASLIWEVAVAFSGRCSDAPDKRIDDDGTQDFAVEGGRIYTEIIRIWGVVFSKEDLENLSETIERSHSRGENCLMSKKLQRLRSSKHDKSTNKRIPRQFSEHIMSSDQKIFLFCPPASPNKTEYHILKFYTFSSALVNIVLNNITRKVDLPFKVTDREHAIIHLQSQAPILLLGRSGTGKTTCCLYRLWTNFIAYWVTSQGIPFMPRAEWFFADTADDQETENEEGTGFGCEETVSKPVLETESDGCGRDKEELEESEAVEEEEEQEEEDIDYGEYDHLHQIFVTKNPVLCTEVKKNFYEMCRAHNETVEHAESATDDTPPRLQDVEDLLYPLFLTSKQLLLMLDASLEPPHFFERDEDGSLTTTVQGWNDEDNAGIPLLDQDYDEGEMEWYYEMEMDEEGDDNPPEAPRPARKQKLDPRREVTYDVFNNIIWPKILKKMTVKYHPSLVWTEIMSFIKGSYEALSKPDGHLSKAEYLEVGRKRAPNFSGERDKIYELFKRYDHYKSQHFMFDESDLVKHIFRRLKNIEGLPWILHQLYVDETQDFTQAELSVLLRITQHPNDMFLTGDTAQGIMRGISFRFCDLQTLFHHAKMSLEKHERRLLNKPKQVYQLTHSYRSHAGILSLASSVLDLMVEFFPESFDRLKKDQGLFDGPSPILLESCSIEDLLILLQGNNRETSHIEFGAHQAILVVNQAAKEKMPEILSKHSIVLTIYESKGLEFDDVLLYNFFTDSEATKEWRVVTTYLESLSAHPWEEEDKENLHAIDEEMLKQPNRPRPLPFDANQHKVLNSELKYLYTALTRARVNVWLFDEDQGKRAPMFEYFKARKLVRSITESEESVSEFEDMVFAMKSSPEDWVRRGDEMMAQSLYDVAAKCYEMGWDRNKENLALAYSQAHMANRMKDTPRKMRDEFTFAAHKFFECGEVLKATQCLQNAQEFELAGRSYKKMNRFQEAARMFQRARNFNAASECYEDLGQYNKAVQVLDKEELYEQAIQCLKRYNSKLQTLTEGGAAVPKVLHDNKPQLTEKDLNLKLIVWYHNQREKAKLLVTLKQLSHEEQLDFLENHEYLEETAELMLKGGSSSHSDVAEMMLRHGKNERALQHAQKGEDLEILGKCHHSIALNMYADCGDENQLSKSSTDSDRQKTKTIHHFWEAKEAYRKAGNSNSAGVACYYIAYITKTLRDAKDAYFLFKNVKPFPNDAGILEAWWIVLTPIRKDSFSDCRHLVSLIDTLLNVMYILLCPDGPEQRNKQKLYLQLYGLHENEKDQNTLLIYPKQRPLCAEINVIPNYGKKEKKECITRNKDELTIQISLYLTRILKSWARICNDWLSHNLSRSLQCQSFVEGREVQEGKACENVNCPHIHEAFNKISCSKALELLFWMVNLDATVHQGIKQIKAITLRLTSKGDLDKELSSILQGRQFDSCVKLLDFLIPESHYTRALTFSKEFMQKPAMRKVKDHVRDYLDQSLKCTLEQKCAGTDWLVRTTTFASLFNLSRDVKRLCYTIESQLDKDKDLLEKERNLAFVVHKNNEGSDIIQSFGSIFHESVSFQKDVVTAIFTYTRYVKFLGKRNKPSIFPRMPLFLSWHEGFLTVTFITLLKLLPSRQCVLPATYLQTLSWMNSTVPKGDKTIQQLISVTTRNRNSIKDLNKRLVHFAGLLCGYDTGMNLLRYLFQLRAKEETFPFLVAERCLVLALVFLSNVGTFIPSELEEPLMNSILNLELPENAPKRLVLSLKAIQESHGVDEVVSVLKTLLQQRDDEYLFLCTWQWDTKCQEGLKYEQIKTAEKISLKFFTELEGDPEIETPEKEEADEVLEEEVTLDDDIQRHQEEQQKYAQEEQEDNSARIIQRFFRRVTFTGRVEMGNIKQRCKKQVFTEMFTAYQITKEMCGICWVPLRPEHAELLEMDVTVTEVSVDQMSTQEPDNDSLGDDVSIKSIANLLLDQEDESQSLYEAHLATQSHQQNVANFHLFKALHEEYFMSLVPEIQEFIEDLRYQKVFINDPHIQLGRFEYMMNVVYEILNKIFMENLWYLVDDLRSKLVPLCLYYKKAVEEANFLKNQYMQQQQQQLQQQQLQIIEPQYEIQEQEAVTIEPATVQDPLDTVAQDVEDEILNVEYDPSKDVDSGHPPEGVDAGGGGIDGEGRHEWRGQDVNFHRGQRGRHGGDFRGGSGDNRGGREFYRGGGRHYGDNRSGHGNNRGGRGDNRGGYRYKRGGRGDNRGGHWDNRGSRGGVRRGGRYFQQDRQPNLPPRLQQQMREQQHQQFQRRRFVYS